MLELVTTIAMIFLLLAAGIAMVLIDRRERQCK